MSLFSNRTKRFLRLALCLVLLIEAGSIQAVGTWSVVPFLPPQPDRLFAPSGVVADSKGNLYVADRSDDDRGRVMKRSPEGVWTEVTTGATGRGLTFLPSQVFSPTGLAVDAADNLYVADYGGSEYNYYSGIARSRVLKRSPEGNWTVVAALGLDAGQVIFPLGVAVDGAGNVYVLDSGDPACGSRGRLQMRDPQGRWTVLADCDEALAPDDSLRSLHNPRGLAADGAGNLYITDGYDPGYWGLSRVLQRDPRGRWTVLAPFGAGAGEVIQASGITLDGAGSLYVADASANRVQKRDSKGVWTEVIAFDIHGFPGATSGYQCSLTVDRADNLYVTDRDAHGIRTRYGRVLKRDPEERWTDLGRPFPPGHVALPSAAAADGAGGVYVADRNDRIQKQDAGGRWTEVTVFGTGPGQTNSPRAVAVDRAGSLYVADLGSGSDEGMGRIQKRDAGGNWTVLATGGTGLGQIDAPRALAVDGQGNLYVADDGGADGSTGVTGRVQKRDALGNWSEIASAGRDLGQVLHPRSMAADEAGNLFIADSGGKMRNDGSGGRVQKRDVEGNWTVLAAFGSGLGRVNSCEGLAMDEAGNLYVADIGGNGQGRVQKMEQEGAWSLLAIAGSTKSPILSRPVGLAADGAGNLFVLELDNSPRMQKRDAGGNWTLLTTTDPPLNPFQYPMSLAVDAADTLYVAEINDHRVRKRDAAGNWIDLTTAGTEIGQVYYPMGLAVDGAGTLYVVELNDRNGSWRRGRVQQRDAAGNWTVLATSGKGLGQVTAPQALAVDRAGNLYVGDIERIQKRDARGNWTVLAGTGKGLGQVDDGLRGLAVDRAGNLYVADTGGNRGANGSVAGRVQKRDAAGNWTEVVTAGIDPGHVTNPRGLVVDGDGSLYVADDGLYNYYTDSSYGRVQKRDADGNWSVIAAQGRAVGQVNAPGGLMLNSGGSLYVADAGNSRVQKYTVTWEPRSGDVNGDGKVGARDVTLALRSALGFLTLTPDQIAAADLNEDGQVKISDALLILRTITGR